MSNVAFNASQVYNIKESIGFAEGSIVSKIIKRDDKGNVTLFSFDKGQNLSEHTAPFDALVQIIEGTAKVIINKKEYLLHEGEMIIMPADIPHALEAEKPFKMLLTMLKK